MPAAPTTTLTWTQARARLARAVQQQQPPETIQQLRAEFAVARLTHHMRVTLGAAPQLNLEQASTLHQALDSLTAGAAQ